MVNSGRISLALFAIAVGAILVDRPIGIASIASAQSSSDRSRDDGDRGSSRRDGDDERRESWRTRNRDRDGDRGRSRDGGDRDDDRRDRDDKSSRTTSRTTSTSSSGSESGLDVKAWATKFVKEHDKNSNGMLESEEQGSLGSAAAASDLNKDGKITIDELVMRNSAGTSAEETKPAATGPSVTSTESAERRDGERTGFLGRGSADHSPRTDTKAAQRVFVGAAGGIQKGKDDKNPRRSFRFTPAAERLPTGLPSWFKSRDANHDGQVAMSEYSRSWSKRTVDEFRKYDLNDDGIVTPKEAAK